MKYRNPWHSPTEPMYGPEYYETNAKPEEYKGYLIYNRLDGVFDVVKEGMCLTQMAGPNGAKQWIDKREQTTP